MNASKHQPSHPSRGVGDPRAAIGLLTRVPVGSHAAADPGGSAAWFPAVGLFVAGAGILAYAVSVPWFGTSVAAILAVATTVMVTGAFHEDGLADFADGVWGGDTPARRLEIMRDSRLGTYGTVALVGELALRVALLSALDTGGFVQALVVAETAGRLAPLVVARVAPPARGDGQGATLRPPSAAGWTLAVGTALVVGAAAVGVAALGVV
ncbi:MAG: adenosylcobinamide-GDP ribazoletransferase, partial [Nitriliruptoraceae bacterium]